MAIDPKLIDDLNSRRKKVILSGGQEKIDKRHEKGEMTARDRMGYLFEEGTFSEIGMHVRHNCHNFGMGKKEIPGDGVVSGFGLVDGRPVACAASDFLAQGGSLGYMHAMKIADAQKYALKAGIPMVTVNDSGGARLQEGVAALSGYAQVFYNNVLASGVVPQISMILGPCAGGAAYSPALTDFIIMRNSGNAGMYITGPKVIEQVTYEKCTMDDIGSAAIHATVSGTVTAIEEREVPSGGRALCVIIKNDFKDNAVEMKGVKDYMSLDAKTLSDIVRDAGIVGMGGAAFPTNSKIASTAGKTEDVLINACECEPYITSDDTIMCTATADVIGGARLLAKVLGAKKSIIAVEDNKPEAIEALRAEAGDDELVEIRVLPTRYPQGAKKQLILAVTGHEVAPGARSGVPRMQQGRPTGAPAIGTTADQSS